MHLCLTHTRMHQTSCVPSSNTHSNRLWNVGTTWRPVLFSFDSVHFPLGTSKENICLKHSESSGNNSFLGFLMKKDFFNLSSACVFIRESKQMRDCVHDKKKNESLVCAFVSFSACVLLIPSCSCFHVLCTQWYSVLAAGWVKNKKRGGHVQTEGGCVNMMCVLVCLQGKNLKNQEMTDM